MSPFPAERKVWIPFLPHDIFLSLENVLHFPRKDLQAVVAPSCILHPPSCTNCLLSLGKLTFLAFVSLLT